MAVTARLVLRRRWWVVPYVWPLSLFVTCFGFAIDDDDLQEWLACEGERIAKHGFRCELVEDGRG